jgi:3-deoxy-D-manno-octulosonic acid kinase
MSQRIEPRAKRVGDDNILYDANRLQEVSAAIFCPAWLEATNRLIGKARGRGDAYFLSYLGEEWVLRHYRRGGLIGKIVDDYYFGWELERSRSWREWRLLAELFAFGLPVPRPIAARVSRSGLYYRADLLTERIPDAAPLADRLVQESLPAETWQRIGRCIREFHDLGVHHADLNARNILLDGKHRPFLIDFDRGQRSPRPVNGRRNVLRLLRSLDKFKDASPDFHFTEEAWQAFLQGYGEAWTR